MSYEERNAWAAMLVNVLIVGYFGWKVITMNADGAFAGPDGPTIWARTVLWMIPASIVATIVLTIVFNIAAGVAARGENPDYTTDERDKRFSARSMITAMIVISLGWLGGLILLAMGGAVLVTLNVVLFGFAAGSFASDVTKIFFYRRGY